MSENLKNQVVEHTNEMILFKKEIESQEKTFDTFFLKYPNGNVFVNCQLSNEVKAKLLVSKCKFPMVITLTCKEIYDEEGNVTFENDYFLKDDTFVNKYGENQTRKVCVITDYRKVENYTFAGMTLDELFDNLVEASK